MYLDCGPDRVELGQLAEEPGPAIALRELLTVSKRAGEPFESAWDHALTTVADKGAWRSALRDTREEWRFAYEDVRAGAGRALGHSIDVVGV